MTLCPKVLLLVAALGLAACNNPDRYGAGGARRWPGAPVARAGSTPRVWAIRTTRRSIAYFNQTVGDRVLFAVDQSTLSPEARNILTGQANWLNTNPDYAIIIEGHADEQGTREYNLALGARRAAAVQDFLIAKACRRPDAHDLLWQGTPDRGLLGRGLLCQEPPRRDGAVGGAGGLMRDAAASALSLALLCPAVCRARAQDQAQTLADIKVELAPA